MRGEAAAARDAEVERLANARKAVWATVAAGIAFAVLFLGSMFTLSRIPGPRASDAAIMTFYASEQRRLVVLTGLYLLPFAAVAFLWFVAVLRDWESNSVRRLNRMLSNVQLLSGIVFITLILASAGATVVTAFASEFSGVQVEPALARQFPLYGSALLYVFAMRMAAIFVTSTTGLIRATGMFHRRFLALSYVVAAFLFLAASLSVWLVLVFPAWIIILCAMIALRVPVNPPAAATVAADDPLAA